MHWRRKWQPTPVFLPRESQGWGSLAGCCLWGRRVGHDWSDLAAAALTPVFLPGEYHGQMSLADYGWWGHKELDPTERLTLHLQEHMQILHSDSCGLDLACSKKWPPHTHSYFLLLSLSLSLLFKLCPWSLPYRPIDTYSLNLIQNSKKYGYIF